jgi:tRNA-binding protein
VHNYNPNDLLGKQVAAVINFPPKQIGKMISEVLVLGFPNEENNPILVMPSEKVPNGGKLF